MNFKVNVIESGGVFDVQSVVELPDCEGDIFYKSTAVMPTTDNTQSLHAEILHTISRHFGEITKDYLHYTKRGTNA